MIRGQLGLIAWLAAFVGTHVALSHPFRRPIVNVIGERGFLLAYSAVSFATFIPALFAYADAPRTLLFTPLPGARLLASILMLIACVLLVGSLLRNPALPGQVPRRKPITGAFAITRHPMMWAFALWALAHGLANGDAPTTYLCLAVGGLALIGARLQDLKKQALLGLAWTSYMDRTNYWPLGQQIKGRLPWTSLWPGILPALGGIALFLLLAMAHRFIAGVPLGLLD